MKQCVSGWVTYISQDDTRSIQYQATDIKLKLVASRKTYKVVQILVSGSSMSELRAAWIDKDKIKNTPCRN